MIAPENKTIRKDIAAGRAARKPIRDVLLEECLARTGRGLADAKHTLPFEAGGPSRTAYLWRTDERMGPAARMYDIIIHDGECTVLLGDWPLHRLKGQLPKLLKNLAWALNS